MSNLNFTQVNELLLLLLLLADCKVITEPAAVESESQLEKSKRRVLSLFCNFIKHTVDGESQQSRRIHGERGRGRASCCVCSRAVGVCECGDKRTEGKGSKFS